MILGRFGLCVLGAAVAALAAASPAVAADGEARQGSKTVAPAARGDQAAHSRRVELPFLLDSAPPVEVPQTPATERDTGPHPYRELVFKRAAFHRPRGRALRLFHLELP